MLAWEALSLQTWIYTFGKRLVIHPSAAGWRCVILGG
jgi:hypothetical protein